MAYHSQGRGATPMVKEENQPKAKKNQGVIRGAMVMTLGTLASRILGLVRDLVIFAGFEKGLTDAFVAAFRLPNFFRRLLGEGALSSAYIPIANKLDSEEREQDLKRLESLLMTQLFLIATLIVLAFIPFAEFILSKVVAGVYENNEIRPLLVNLAKGLIFYLIPVTQFGLMMAFLNRRKDFFAAGLAPALFNLGLICVVLFFKKYLSEDNLLIGAVLFGGLLQWAVVTFRLKQMGALPKLSFGWSADVTKVIKKLLPALWGLSAFQLMGLLNLYFGSKLGLATISHLYMADRLIELPQSLIVVSLGASLLPFFSKKWSEGKKADAKLYIKDSLKFLYFLLVPSVVGLFLFREEITGLLFGYGKNTPQDVSAISFILGYYCVLIFLTSLVKIFSPLFFAVSKAWVPASTSTLVLGIHFILGHSLLDMGLKGLLLSMILAQLIGIIWMLLFYQKNIGDFPVGTLFKNIGINALLSLPFVGIYFGFQQSLGLVSAGWMTKILLLVAIGVCAICYFGLAILFKHSESDKIKGLVRKMIGKIIK